MKHRVHSRQAVGAAIDLLLLAFTLSACGPAAESPEDSPTKTIAPMSADQAAAIADGTVSREAYDDGFRRYQACLADAGYSLVDVREEYQQIHFGVPAAAVESGADERCYDFEYRKIDEIWQLSIQDQSKTAIMFGQCLDDAGLDSSGTRADKLNRMREHGITIEQCLESRG